MRWPREPVFSVEHLGIFPGRKLQDSNSQAADRFYRVIAMQLFSDQEYERGTFTVIIASPILLTRLQFFFYRNTFYINLFNNEQSSLSRSN